MEKDSVARGILLGRIRERLGIVFWEYRKRNGVSRSNLAKELGICKERVRQLELRAMRAQKIRAENNLVTLGAQSIGDSKLSKNRYARLLWGMASLLATEHSDFYYVQNGGKT